MKLEGKPKEQIEKLKTLLPIGKMVRVQFSKHEDTTKLLDVMLATQDAIKKGGGNVPPKRLNADGKEVTPAVVSIILESSTLDIVLEDIDDIYLMGNGARLTFQWGNLEIVSAE
jgi:hypothetical protein